MSQKHMTTRVVRNTWLLARKIMISSLYDKTESHTRWRTVWNIVEMQDMYYSLWRCQFFNMSPCHDFYTCINLVKLLWTTWEIISRNFFCLYKEFLKRNSELFKFFVYHMSLIARKPVFRVSDQARQNQPAQSQKPLSGMNWFAIQSPKQSYYQKNEQQRRWSVCRCACWSGRAFCSSYMQFTGFLATRLKIGYLHSCRRQRYARYPKEMPNNDLMLRK